MLPQQLDMFAEARWWRQDPRELEQFLALVRRLGVKRYLEIGANNGDTFAAVMDAAGPGAFGMAIDLPWDAQAQVNLEHTVWNYRGKLVLGDSHSDAPRKAARDNGPFDLILIDGDHTFDGVARDWMDYGDLAPVIVFHDIAAPPGHMASGQPVGVPALWEELAGMFRTEEFVTPGSKMGFGVLYAVHEG